MGCAWVIMNGSLLFAKMSEVHSPHLIRCRDRKVVLSEVHSHRGKCRDAIYRVLSLQAITWADAIYRVLSLRAITWADAMNRVPTSTCVFLYKIQSPQKIRVRPAHWR